jgi:hypothetical protein
MNFIWGFIVGGIVVGFLLDAAYRMRYEKKKFVVRRNRDAPFPSMQPPERNRKCKGYQGLG